MKTIFKKHILLSLIAALLLSSIGMTACSEEETAPETTAAPAETQTAEETSPYVGDDLPSDLDYDGATFNIFVGDYSNAYGVDFWIEEETGTPVDDAVYIGRRNVEERLNLAIEMELFSFVYSNRADFNNRVSGFVMAGDSSIDALFGYTLTSLLTSGNYFLNLADNPYIDLEKPWWNQTLTSLMPSEDTVFFLTGDATLSLIKHTFTMFFNQNLLDANGITENLYDTVRSGSWTLDKLKTYAEMGYVDLNGDGQKDMEDSYGLTFGDANKYMSIPSAFDIPMYEKDSTSGYTFAMDSEYTVNVVDTVCQLFSGQAVLPAVSNTDNPQSIASFGGNYLDRAFCENRALFTYSLVGDAGYILENCDFTLGMIPIPKFSEAQADYQTSAQRFAHIYVPVSVSDFDRAGAVIEAWGSEFYRSVMPVFFESTLKSRYSSDNDMAQMFDLIRDSLTIQFGTVFATNLEMNVNNFKEIQNGGKWTSTAASKKKASVTKLAELVAALQAAEQG